MPDQQPSNAPDDLPENPGDQASAAAILNDDETTPGGGGLGGAAAADRLGGSGRAPGGPARNSPIDTGVDAGDAGATRDSQVESAETDPPEPHPSSR